MREFLRTHNWSSTPLGAPESWPRILRNTVDLVADARFPMFVLWGADLTWIYNQSFVPIAGLKHPQALGRPFAEVWPEIWDDLRPLIGQALAGQSVYREDLPLTLRRLGVDEQAWFTFSYSPVRDETGKIAGLLSICTETTKKVLAERDRIADSDRLRALFRQAPGFMALVREPDHIFELVNDAYYHLVGARDIIGRPVREALPELAGQGFFELLDQVYQDGEPFVGESIPVRLRRQRGAALEERLVTFVFQPIRDAEGRVDGVFAEGHDVTDAKRAEQALRRSEAHLARAQRVAGIGSWELDVRTGAITWSEETYRIYGVDPANFRPDYDQIIALFHGDDRPIVEAHVQEVLANGIALEITARFRRGDGALRWGRLVADRLAGPDETSVGLVGTVQDVTERKRISEQLRFSEAVARGIIEALPDAYIRTDHLGKVMEWNNRAEVLFGWTRSEAIGRSLEELILPTDEWEAFRARLRLQHSNAHLDTPVHRRTRMTVLGANRQEIPVELTGVILRVGDELIANGFFRDLREEIAREEHLRQVQKIEAVGQLTGGIAHDFNNLLAINIGNLDLLEEYVSDNAEATELLTAARAASLRGADLTGRLLAFARRQPLQPRSLDANRLLSEYSKLLDRLLGDDVELRLELSQDVWHAKADPHQLEAAITNLATNARDAMPRGGRLTISIRNEVIYADYAATHPDVAPGDYVAITVSDTGTGMPPEVLARAYEPFFTTKGEGKGTGLGLSMVLGFAKQSGGHVRIYSEVEHGTSVSILLPRSDEDKQAEQATAAPTPRARPGEVILLVEDNAGLRRVAAQQMKALGYTVIEAGDGPSALQIIEAAPRVDLVLTDVIMPGGMTGLDVGRELQQNHTGIKVIYMSGFPEAALGNRAHLAPDIVLLRKPVRQAELGIKIREALDD